jgi:hypothetical protein
LLLHEYSVWNNLQQAPATGQIWIYGGKGSVAHWVYEYNGAERFRSAIAGNRVRFAVFALSILLLFGALVTKIAVFWRGADIHARWAFCISPPCVALGLFLLFTIVRSTADSHGYNGHPAVTWVVVCPDGQHETRSDGNYGFRPGECRSMPKF